ncbi:sensor histidine kinase [Nocardia pseudobrasiliensis]|nr:sensor histidine kinase [Nocardia pseudobrasiliensis]
MSMTAAPPATSAALSAPPWHQRFAVRHRTDSAGPDRLDTAIALFCLVAFTGPLVIGMATGIGSTAQIAAFGVAATAPLLVRRRWPLAVLVAVTAVLCAAALAGVRFTPWVSNTGPALGIAVLTLANQRRRGISIPATTLALIAIHLSVMIAFHWHADQDQDAVQLIIALPAWLIGDSLRTRREYRHGIAEQQRRREAESERRIRAEERLRISRDVHDLISHTLSMVAVRSGVARLLIDENPAEVRQALSTIETASRSALTELRAVLSRIREPAQSDEPLEPGLDAIPALVDGLRHDGLVVELRVSGTPVTCPALLQTTIYRIVQESLTNVVKHAHTNRARVEMRWADTELTVSILDDGPDAEAAPDTGASGSGMGLAGIRERVSLFGGRFEAGPRVAGGFAVIVDVPIEASHHV